MSFCSRMVMYAYTLTFSEQKLHPHIAKSKHSKSKLGVSFKVVLRVEMIYLGIILFSFSNLANTNELAACAGEKSSNISIIELSSAIYPTSPVASMVEGYTTLQIIVLPNGKLKTVHVIDSKPKRRFDLSAIKAMQKSVLSKSNTKQERCGIFTYEFKLEQDS
ncbi:MAG: TonB family protein [Marinicellaceae bacterium]